GSETLFHYHQHGEIVTAEYRGGSIVTGHLIAKILLNGQLDMRYHHLNEKRRIYAGEMHLDSRVITRRPFKVPGIMAVALWRFLFRLFGKLKKLKTSNSALNRTAQKRHGG